MLVTCQVTAIAAPTVATDGAEVIVMERSGRVTLMEPVNESPASPLVPFWF